MKKIILFLIIASVGAVSCKKEKTNTRLDKPIAEGIQGVWYTVSGTHDYFDANNNKIFSQPIEAEWKYTIKEQITVDNSQGVRQFRTDYTVSTANNKNYFNFTDNGVAHSYEITSLDVNTMGWREERANASYQDNGQKMAAKVVSTVSFRCPCR